MLVYLAPGEGYPLDLPVNYSSSSFSSSVSTTDEICLELGFWHYSHLYTSNVVHESPLAPQLQVDPVQVLWTYSCWLVAVEQIWEQYLHSHSSTGICAHLTCSVAHSVVGGSFNLWRTLLISNLYLKSRSGSTASPKYRRNNKDRKFIQSSSIHAQLQLLRISSSVSQPFPSNSKLISCLWQMGRRQYHSQTMHVQTTDHSICLPVLLLWHFTIYQWFYHWIISLTLVLEVCTAKWKILGGQKCLCH